MKKSYNLNAIMGRAWAIRKSAAAEIGCAVSEVVFSLCLKQAWAEAEGVNAEINAAAVVIVWVGSARMEMLGAPSAGDIFAIVQYIALVMNGALDYNIPYLAIALVGLACSVVAQLGDLSFSFIKREFGIKDYGRIFLEHGGVLDRFDSVLFVAPALEVLIHLAGLVQGHG